MKLAAVLQVGGLAATAGGVLVLFGAGWAVLAAGVASTVVGTALELERRG